MRQATLQLKNRIQNVNIMNNNIEIRRVVLKTMISVFVALSLWYVIILLTMVVNIVERRTLEKEALTLSNQVGDLELSYLSTSNSVDMTLSSSMGFKEVHASFATRKALGYNLNTESPSNLKPARNEI